MHAGGVIFWVCVLLAFFITTVVVIVLVLTDWCNRFAQTEEACPSLQLWQVHTGGSPPSNNPTVQDVVSGDEPQANVAWVRNGSLVWLGFTIEFPLCILPSRGTPYEITFQTLVLEFTSNCAPRPKHITRDNSLFRPVGACFLNEADPDTPPTVDELMCEIDIKRRPGTTVVVVAKDITLQVDANGSAFVHVTGNIVYPPDRWLTCCSRRCCRCEGVEEDCEEPRWRRNKYD